MITTKEDIEHLRWLYDRLQFVHGESARIDYMIRFKKIIDGLGNEKGILNDIVDYEITSSWWASFISNEWLQDKVASYFVRRAKRKLQRLKTFSKNYKKWM